MSGRLLPLRAFSNQSASGPPTSISTPYANSINDGLCTEFPVNDHEPNPSLFFAAYSNPSSSAAIIEYALPHGHSARLRVFNNTGVLMAEYDVVENSGVVALPKFPAGLYFVSLEVEGAGARTFKLVQL